MQCVRHCAEDCTPPIAACALAINIPQPPFISTVPLQWAEQQSPFCMQAGGGEPLAAASFLTEGRGQADSPPLAITLTGSSCNLPRAFGQQQRSEDASTCSSSPLLNSMPATAVSLPSPIQKGIREQSKRITVAQAEHPRPLIQHSFSQAYHSSLPLFFSAFPLPFSTTTRNPML